MKHSAGAAPGSKYTYQRIGRLRPPERVADQTRADRAPAAVRFHDP